MYRIYCDDKTLHDVRDEEYQLITPKISLELNKTGSFEFGILPSHPHVNDIKKLKSRLKVYDVDISDSGEASRLLYCGRSITDPQNLNLHPFCGIFFYCNSFSVDRYDYISKIGSNHTYLCSLY